MKWQILTSVMKKPLYSGLTIGVMLFIILLSVWIPQWVLLRTVFTSEAFGFVDGLIFLFTLLGSAFTNFTVFSLLTTLGIGVLTGVLISLTLYSYRERKRESLTTRAITGGIGVGSGALGLGCAACGSIALSGIASSLGLTSIALLLPFGGKELTILSIGILMFAIYQQLKLLTRSTVCPIT